MCAAILVGTSLSCISATCPHTLCFLVFCLELLLLLTHEGWYLIHEGIVAQQHQQVKSGTLMLRLKRTAHAVPHAAAATSSHFLPCATWFVPLQHTSARSWNDRDKTLWCGWAVLGRSLRFWFAGDTGYCGVFKEIGQEYGPFDLCAIPIASYTPRQYLKHMHVNPADAVQIHQVRCRTTNGCIGVWHHAVVSLSLCPTSQWQYFL